MATKNNKVDYSDYVRRFWKLFFYSFGGVFLFFLLASWGFFGKMPSFDELENPDTNIATEIISSDGKTIGKFYKENRTPVKYEDLPPHLVKALVATEDERFYEHSGIDARGTLRAVASLGRGGGASTITQQLAKNLFHGEGSKFILFRIIQKCKEWIISTKLERQYTKQEIIALYLNKVDFVNGAVGIRSAAKIYMNKEPKNLTIEESALFVGMLKNPALFNPTKEKRRAKVLNRRNTVFDQMVKNKFITQEVAEVLKKRPVKINFKPESHSEGMATYFREYIREELKEWVKNNPNDDGDEYDIYTDGLKIYTTIDSRMQQYAEEAVSEHLANLQKEFFRRQKDNPNAPFLDITPQETDKIIKQAMKNSERWRVMSINGKEESEIVKSFDVPTKMKVFTWKGERDTIMKPKDSILYYKHFLQAGMMAMEPQTGYVKAWVGGINYKYFQYDHVGQGARQVGSTFKPFVYATCIDRLEKSPCDMVLDAPYTILKGDNNDKDWTPNNSDGKYRGLVTLKKALANSINTVSARLIHEVGAPAVVDMAKKLGVTANIPNRPAIALGAVEITVSEMVAAFSTFANEGVYIKPQLITRIEDKNGVVIYQATPESHDVVNKDVAYSVIKLMEGVTESGTGSRLRWAASSPSNFLTGVPYNIRGPVAGKTGTSQNNSDGWFIGMVPNLAAGVWVGNEDRSAHFKETSMGQGATMALPIYGIFMRKCYADTTLKVSNQPFERPENLSIQVDCKSSPVSNDSTAVDSTGAPIDAQPDANELGLD
nr:PBP1A family penicillin-binding protein [uncultured Flavobacterium sp.]